MRGMSGEVLSRGQARRVALAAQGFLDPRPKGVPDVRALTRVLGRIGLIQIDSVNVLSRTQYLPLYSRLGPYPRDLLDRASGKAPRRLVEYWAHEASLIPVETHPLMRWRMARATTEAWGGPRSIAKERPDLIKQVLADVRNHGPLTARQIDDDVERARDNWGWNWSDVKRALEFLFFAGEITVARRNQQFERLYDVPERVLPARRDRDADPDARTRRTAGWSRSRPGLTGSPPRSACGTTSGPRPRRRSRRSRSWSRRASCSRSGSKAGSARRTCTATRGCRAG